MARLRLANHLSSDELQQRYRESKDPVERTHWQVLWLLSQGRGSQEIATFTGFSVIWVRILVRRFNEGGPEAVGDQRHRNRGAPPCWIPASTRTLLEPWRSRPRTGASGAVPRWRSG